jgi:thiopurine S-methyltransferase
MQPDFWHERWRTGQIGFHQFSADRNLTHHWSALHLAKGGRVFVPLCGKSLDILWLRDHGHSVLGVELSVIALEAFCMENGIAARRRVQGEFEVYEAPALQLYRGDFFALAPALLHDVTAVFDRAALISWTPELRAPYVEHLSALLRPGAQMLLVTLEYPQAQFPGPPFSVTRDEVERLYSSNFRIREIARQDILANEARLRARGVTELFEIGYHLVRL